MGRRPDIANARRFLVGAGVLLIMAPFGWAEQISDARNFLELEDLIVVAQVDPDATALAGSVSAPAEVDVAQKTTVASEASADIKPSPVNPSWIDSGHGYVTGSANVLTRWVDSYFGNNETDLETAESQLRLRLIEDWDERYGNDIRVRVGGKVNLPAISSRLDLVFRGDNPTDEVNGEEDRSQSPIGLQYQVGSRITTKHRFDLTLGMSSSGPRPGVKYRFMTPLSDRNTMRFTQRVQYEIDEGAYATSRLELDHQLSDDQLLRSFSRVFYGRESQGYEWSTSLAHIKRWQNGKQKQRATMLYGEVWGVTEPNQYISNYRLGLRFRRQTYRDYLFLEFEPSYNWRIDEPGLERAGAWKVEIRFEFLLYDDLRRDAEALLSGNSNDG